MHKYCFKGITFQPSPLFSMRGPKYTRDFFRKTHKKWPNKKITIFENKINI